MGDPNLVSSDSSASSDSDPEDTRDNAADTLRLSLVDGHKSVLLRAHAAEFVGEEAGEGEEEGLGEVLGEEEEEPREPLPQAEPVKEDDADKQKKKKRKKKSLSINLTNCKYESVRRAARRFGFREVGEEEDWNLFWTDCSVSLERVMDMKRYQKINHFPGMVEICRKDLLARNMNRLRKLFPGDYNVFPPSWCLPADHGDLMAYTRRRKNKTYILKPESGCQGKGIWLTKTPRDIKPNEHMLCQQYISKPFLIDGYKFDLRVYVLVTACDPLRIFVFKEGLGRFATNKYTAPTCSNVSNVYMHLTNYAINKNSGDFNKDDEGGSKRRISTVNTWLAAHGYDVARMWDEIDDVVIKTLVSAHAILRHNYRTCFPNHVRGSACFEILGFDIVLDRKLAPFVLEVNHSPSFTTDAPIDREIKDTLIYDTLNLVNFGAVDRRRCIEEERKRIKERLCNKQDKRELKDDLDKTQKKWLDEQTEYEDAHLGNFRRIYPSADTEERYSKYFNSSGSLYQETAAYKARSECARQQRLEIVRKQEKLDSMLGGPRGAGARGRGGREPGGGGVRPESPPAKTRARRIRRITAAPKQDLNSVGSTNGTISPGNRQPIRDELTDAPQFIDQWEELARVSGLLERESLIRSAGVLEIVNSLLAAVSNGSGGTGDVGGGKNENKNDIRHSYIRLSAIDHGAGADTAPHQPPVERLPQDHPSWDHHPNDRPSGPDSSQVLIRRGPEGRRGGGGGLRLRPPGGHYQSNRSNYFAHPANNEGTPPSQIRDPNTAPPAPQRPSLPELVRPSSLNTRPRQPHPHESETFGASIGVQSATIYPPPSPHFQLGLLGLSVKSLAAPLIPRTDVHSTNNMPRGTSLGGHMSKIGHHVSDNSNQSASSLGYVSKSANVGQTSRLGILSKSSQILSNPNFTLAKYN